MDEVHKPGSLAQRPPIEVPAETAQVTASTASRVGTAIADRNHRESTKSSAYSAKRIKPDPDVAPDTEVSAVICKGTGNNPFTISCDSQRDAVRSSGMQFAAYIWGGPLLTLGVSVRSVPGFRLVEIRAGSIRRNDNGNDSSGSSSCSSPPEWRCIWSRSTNGLIAVKNNVDKAWANIDVLLKQRHDELPNLLEVCKGYMKYEGDTFQRITQARSAYSQATTVDRK